MAFVARFVPALRHAALVGLLVVLALAPGDARVAQARPDVLRATLENGLRVVIVRNRLAPVAATALNYLVGSDEAPKGFPGTAHALEHMMFRGSPGLSADQLANIGGVMGGNFNANTRESLTQYLFTVPAEDLDIALHIEALRMRAILGTRKDWDRERGAIEQEVAQDLSSPNYVLYERLRAALFAGTPYEHVALGTRPSFERTSAAMLRRFHRDWYAPNNAVLVIAGDVDPAAALSKVRALFGPIGPRKLPPRPGFRFRPQRASSFAVDTDQPAAATVIAMRMPGIDSPDFPALEVLADVLSSRRFDLYGLVPAGKALGAGFSFVPLPRASIGFAEAFYAPGTDPQGVEAELRAILQKVVVHGVPPELVEAAKAQERRQAEFQKNGIGELAAIWSEAVAIYGLRSPDDDLRRIERVSVADVNRVARKYLDLDHATVATMVPKGSGKPVSSGRGFGGQETIALGEAKPTPLPGWAKTSLGRLNVPEATIRPVVSTLANGITLIVQPETVSDTVSLYGHIRNRPETEAPPGKEGVAQILDELFSYGTQSLDRLAFQQALDAIGASESAGVDFSVHTLAGDFDRGVALLADNELHPALPEDAMAIVRDQLARITASRNRTPSYLASRALREALFPKDDPALRDVTPESVAGISHEDVLDYFKRVIRPDMTTIVVIGKITPDEARATVERYFGAWRAEGPKPDTDLPVPPPNRADTIDVPDASRVQDSVVLAETVGINRADPDYYALALGNSVLGGGFYSARLSIDLRKNAGLVYSVGSTLQAGRTRANYFVQFASDPQNVTRAAAIAVRDIRAMQDSPVTDDELARSKMLLLRQIPLSESSVAAIARGLLARRELDLPLDEPWRAARRYIALTPAEVQAAFAKYLRPDDFVRVSQGPAPR